MRSVAPSGTEREVTVQVSHRTVRRATRFQNRNSYQSLFRFLIQYFSFDRLVLSPQQTRAHEGNNNKQKEIQTFVFHNNIFKVKRIYMCV